MVRKVDQERVQTLLKDTITLLCRNGLQFRCRFSIDAVIGVTVDDDEIFLVSMNEVVTSEASHSVPSDDEDDSENQNEISDKVDIKRIKVEHQTDGENDPIAVHSRIGSQTFPSGSMGNSAPLKLKRRQSTDKDVVSSKRNAEVSQVKQEHTPLGDDVELIVSSPESPSCNRERQYTEIKQEQFQLASSNAAPTSTFVSPASNINSEQDGTSQHSQPAYSPAAYIHPGQLQGVRFEGRLACSICPRIFHDSESLVNHEAMHKSTYKFHCKFCMKGFLAKSDYEGHLAMHTGQKQFKCELCGKQYSYRKTLKDHMIFSHNQKR